MRLHYVVYTYTIWWNYWNMFPFLLTSHRLILRKYLACLPLKWWLINVLALWNSSKAKLNSVRKNTLAHEFSILCSFRCHQNELIPHPTMAGKMRKALISMMLLGATKVSVRSLITLTTLIIYKGGDFLSPLLIISFSAGREIEFYL